MNPAIAEKLKELSNSGGKKVEAGGRRRNGFSVNQTEINELNLSI
jgi:hypothetical protein